MRVLKLFLGKIIFQQIFSLFQIFSVERLDGPVLASRHMQSCQVLT